MLGELIVRAVDSFALLTGELDLGAGFDRDARGTAFERERMPVLFVFELPSEALDKLAKNPLDPIGSGIGQGGAIGGGDRDFLVLSADAPLLPRFRAAFEISDQVLFGVDEFALAQTFDSSKAPVPQAGL